MNLNAITRSVEQDIAEQHLDSAVQDAKRVIADADATSAYGPHPERWQQALGALVRAVEHAEHVRQPAPAPGRPGLLHDRVIEARSMLQRKPDVTNLPWHLALSNLLSAVEHGEAPDKAERVERARIILAQEGYPERYSGFDDGGTASLSAALRDMIELVQS